MDDLSIDKNCEIVLFNSPIYRYHRDDGETYLPPLGQGYIITNLKRHGISAALIDCAYNRLSISQIIDIINCGDFPNIGFNIFSINMLLVKEILLGITRNVKIYIGGKAIEHLWKEVLTWNLKYPITFIIGEAECIFPALILQRCKDIPFFDNGVHKAYLVDKNSCYYPFNLDCIDIDRALFKDRNILNHYGRYEACIVASRGCIYNCAFCGGATSVNPGITARVRGNDSLVREIKSILDFSPEVSSIRFLDDLFLRDRKSVVDACRLFFSFPQLHWRCMAHVNTFVHNLDLIAEMKSSRCDEVFIGIESGSPDVRLRIHKNGTPKNIIRVIQKLLTEGIDVKGYFMCGFPGETEDQLQETLDFATKLSKIAMVTESHFRPVVFQFRPYHGTELFNQLVQSGVNINYIRQENFENSKQQYNFSAGNFSKVSDEVLKNYIDQISRLNG